MTQMVHWGQVRVVREATIAARVTCSTTMVHCIAFGCNNKDGDISRGLGFLLKEVAAPENKPI